MRRIPLVVSFPLISATLAAQAQDTKSFPSGMDFGPCMTTTVDCRGSSGYSLKGLVVRLGDQGAVAFDTELLRL